MSGFKSLCGYLMILFVIVGCTQSTSNNGTTIESGPSATYFFKTAVSPSRITPTIQITEVPGGTYEIEDNHFSFDCPDGTTDKIPEDYGLHGTIIYEDLGDGEYKAAGGFPLKDTTIPIPGGVRMSLLYGTSPGAKWLAYSPITGKIGSTWVESSKWTIVLISQEGEQVHHDLSLDGLFADLPEEAQAMSWLSNDWINDRYLVSGFAIKMYKDDRNLTPYYSILDPLNGQWKDDLIRQLPNLNRKFKPFFSPDLSRVLFINTEYDLILWDLLQSNAIKVWSSSDMPMYGIDAAWSPDSSKLVWWGFQSPAAMNITLIDHDGNESLPLHKYLAESAGFAVSDISWSHNSRYLAIALHTTNDERDRQVLYIYDTADDTLAIKCDLHNKQDGRPIHLYWSPDDLAIAYSHYVSSPLFVLDLNTGITVKVADNAIIQDWADIEVPSPMIMLPK